MTDDEYPCGDAVIIESEQWHVNAMKRACVCAVCAGRPCACDLAVLAGLLREAAQFPHAGGVSVAGVRAAAEDARRGKRA